MRRALVGLVLLAVILGVYLFGVELPRDKAAEEEAEAGLALFDFEIADVDTLSYFREGMRLVLAREGEQWQMLEPLAEPALGSAIRAQLEQFSSAVAVKALADSVRSQDWSFYGLADHAHGRRDIRIHLRDGRVQRLAVGNETPSGGFAYVRKADRLLMAERSIHQLSWVRPSGVRRVDLFDVADSSIVKLRVVGPRDQWTAARDDEGRWWRDTPESGVYFSRRRMRQIVFDLTNSNIRSYERRLESAEDEWRAYGLSPAYARIEWWGASGKKGRLDLGNDFDDKEVFARRDQGPDLLRLTRQLVVDAEVLADSLVDHNPLRFNFDRADSVVLRFEDGARLRLERSGKKWRVQGGARIATEEENLDLAAKNFVFSLENLQSDRTWLLPATDAIEDVLDRVPLRIEVYRGSSRARDLRLGWQGRGEAHWLASNSPATLHRIGRSLYVAARGLGLLTGRLDP